MTGQRDLRRETRAVEHHVARNGRRDHAGNGAQLVIDAPDKCGALSVVITEHAEVEADNGDVVGIEAGIDGLRVSQAAHEKAREDERDGGQRRLRDEQR